jgi:hypothetical protein
MKSIISSASKIVFITLTLGLIVLTCLRIVEPKDFVMLAGMAFTYYFSKPNQPLQG